MSALLLIMMMGENIATVDSADFDGSADYMLRGGGLTGAADSKTGILSVWLRIDGGDGGIRRVIEGIDGINTTFARIGSDNKFGIRADNTSGTEILALSSDTAYTAAATWLHVLMSWNLATASGHLYVNDVEDLAAAPTLTDDTIDYTLANWGIGSVGLTVPSWNGCMAELYFAPGQYLDFSNVYYRRKFISYGGKPVYLGTDGSLPTGTAPIVYSHLADAEAVANFATNRGTGGDFTITGTLATGSTSPSD